MPSKLEQMQLQFRQKLMQEKEERMIKIHTDNQQKALSKVAKYNSTTNNNQRTTTTLTVTKSPMTIAAPQAHHSPVKKGSPGVDRSRPLPPISKDPRRNYNPASSRHSPVSAPIENLIKTNGNGVRSKSVELEARQSPTRVSNGKTPQSRNGYGRSSFETAGKSSTVQRTYETKTEPDSLARVKQAELQRLRANSKFQAEEQSPRNGYATYAVSKSSSEQRKPAATSKQQGYAPARSEFKPQATTSNTFKRTTPAVTRNGKPGVPAVQSRKPPGPGQEQCNVCGRNFNQDRIEKHRTVCAKTAKKKVKVFDATKMRVQGTEAEQFVKKGLPKTTPKPKNSNWRKQHQEFIEAIRQAKIVQQHLAAGGKVADLPPPPPSDTSHYVPCPHCGRKFNEGVADRHIPKCKNIVSNKKAPPPKRK